MSKEKEFKAVILGSGRVLVIQRQEYSSDACYVTAYLYQPVEEGTQAQSVFLTGPELKKLRDELLSLGSFLDSSDDADPL